MSSSRKNTDVTVEPMLSSPLYMAGTFILSKYFLGKSLIFLGIHNNLKSGVHDFSTNPAYASRRC